MKLFRRMLMMLLPGDVFRQDIGPGGMFLSFVSPKNFFSTVNRKIVENYKLNMFDISLDSFEAKIGFGEKPNLLTKDLDYYYSYAVVANMNGYTFYSPSNIGTLLTLLVSTKVRTVFKKHHRSVFYNFLLSINILCIVFAARIKVFPYPKEEKEKNYTRFISVFFNFFALTLQGDDTSKKERNAKKLEILKKELLRHIEVFFMLFHVYQHLNELYYSPGQSERDFHQWMLYDYLQESKHAEDIQEFIAHATAYSRVSQCSNLDERIIKLLLPKEMVMKYLFHHQHMHTIVHKLVSTFYDTKEVDQFLLSFLKSDEQLQLFLEYLFDFSKYKHNYYDGMKDFMSHVFDYGKSYQEEEELESFFAAMDGKDGLVTMDDLPKSLKEKSLLADRSINFYIMCIAGLRVGKGDNFSMRLFGKTLLMRIFDRLRGEKDLSQPLLMYYGAVLYNYSQNTFYYKYVYDRFRKGAQHFKVPTQDNSKHVYSNMYILQLFDEYALTTAFQDIYKRSMSIHVAKDDILVLFQDMFAKRISPLVQAIPKDRFTQMYMPFFALLPSVKETIFEEEDAFLVHYIESGGLVDALYGVDFWLWHDAMDLLGNESTGFQSTLDDRVILGLVASMRETLLGFMLFFTYVQQQEKVLGSDLYTDVLLRVYIKDVLMIGDAYVAILITVLKDLAIGYGPLFELWGTLDENTGFFDIGLGSWIECIQEKSKQEVIERIKGSDIVWFRGFVKNIAYYNKRVVIPSGVSI